MPNLVRNFQPGGLFHIYNRGNHRDPVYLEGSDYRYFLTLLRENSELYDVQVLAYCLMRNHYHLMIKLGEEHPDPARFIGCSGMSYSHYYNQKYDQVGSVFQGRYRSKPVLTTEGALHLSRYIHANPSEFCDPELYAWSSLPNYLSGRRGLADPTLILEFLAGQPYALEESHSWLRERSRTS